MAELPWSSATIELRAAPALRQVGLRLRPPFPAYLAGLPLPLQPNRVATRGAMRILWLGPDEWLVVAPDEGGADLPTLLGRAVLRRRAAISDLSSSRAVIEIGGVAARDLLAAGCGLDFHPRAFRADQCAQTLFARVPVILDQLDEAPHYRLLVRRSYVRWLCDWLVDTAEGLPDAVAADEPRPAAGS
jgi:sarcosine oxidase subunit gamma